MRDEYLVLSIDRLELSEAICEDSGRAMHRVARVLLPHSVKEGDCIRLYPDGRIEIDAKETELRRERIRKLQRKVFEND